VNHLIDGVGRTTDSTAAFIGLEEGRIKFNHFQDFPRLGDRKHQRPKTQWWMALRPIARVMAKPCPQDECAE